MTEKPELEELLKTIVETTGTNEKHVQETEEITKDGSKDNLIKYIFAGILGTVGVGLIVGTSIFHTFANNNQSAKVPGIIKRTLPTNPNATYSLTLVAVDNNREPWNIGGNKEIKLEGMTDDILLEILGEELYKHLLENTDSGYEPIGNDNAIAAKWTRVPVKIIDNNESKYNFDKINQLAKYCGKLQEYAGMLCDNNYHNREITHLAIRRHVK